MRLKNYITEAAPVSQEIWEHLKRNCSEFIEFYKTQARPTEVTPSLSGGRMFYRGVKQSIPKFETIVPRKNRKPLSSAEWLQEMEDDAFEKRFGWRPRQSGVFTLSLYPSARSSISAYGKDHLFFPYNGYTYLWSPQIGDLFSIYPYSKNDEHYKDLETIIRRSSRNEKDYQLNLKEWKQRFEGWMDSYIEDKLPMALNVRIGHEVMFKCKKYTLVNPKFENALIDKIWGDRKPL